MRGVAADYVTEYGSPLGQVITLCALKINNGHLNVSTPAPGGAIETLEKWARALNVHISQLFLIDGAGVPKDIFKNIPKRRRAAMSTDALRSLQGISRYIEKIEPKKRTLLVMLAREMAE